MRQAVVVAVAFFLGFGCSGSPTTPTAPPTATITPTVPVVVVTPSDFVISGRATAVNGGQALGGLDVSIPGYVPVKTSTDGSFSVTVAPRNATYQLGFTGSAIVPRTITLAVTGSRSIAVDAISQTSPFNLSFYRQLVRNQTSTRQIEEKLSIVRSS